jgi:hypothetical protein
LGSGAPILVLFGNSLASLVRNRKLLFGTFLKFWCRKAVYSKNALNYRFMPKIAVFQKKGVPPGKFKISKVELVKRSRILDF